MSSRADQRTARTVQRELFSDLTVDLSVHPMTHELSRSLNENAVKRSVRNIVMTDFNERPFQPKLGCGVRRLLFEPMSSATSESIKHAIVDAITAYEPRVKLSEVRVVADELSQVYRVDIVFLIVNYHDPVGMTITLERIR